MIVAVIPARGGSKRIPRKNIRTFCGKPMISWSISAAIKSDCFDRIIVSTDDFEIATISRQYGAEVPFVRPAELSGDHTPTIPVIAHAIDWLQDHHETPQYVCCIYATAPFLLAEDLRVGQTLIKERGLDYVFSATRFSFPIQRAFRLDSEEHVDMFYPEYRSTRSQDLEEAFHDAGQFYWGRTSAWSLDLPIFAKNSAVIQLPSWRVQDIDDEEDWVRAEKLFRMSEVLGDRR